MSYSFTTCTRAKICSNVLTPFSIDSLAKLSANHVKHEYLRSLNRLDGFITEFSWSTGTIRGGLFIWLFPSHLLQYPYGDDTLFPYFSLWAAKRRLILLIDLSWRSFFYINCEDWFFHTGLQALVGQAHLHSIYRVSSEIKTLDFLLMWQFE